MRASFCVVVAAGAAVVVEAGKLVLVEARLHHHTEGNERRADLCPPSHAHFCCYPAHTHNAQGSKTYEQTRTTHETPSQGVATYDAAPAASGHPLA